MITIICEYYIYNDTINHYKSAVYMQIIIYYILTVYLLISLTLIITYQNINSELHHNFKKSISIKTFIKTLNS